MTCSGGNCVTTCSGCNTCQGGVSRTHVPFNVRLVLKAAALVAVPKASVRLVMLVVVMLLAVLRYARLARVAFALTYVPLNVRPVILVSVLAVVLKACV